MYLDNDNDLDEYKTVKIATDHSVQNSNHNFDPNFDQNFLSVWKKKQDKIDIFLSTNTHIETMPLLFVNNRVDIIDSSPDQTDQVNNKIENHFQPPTSKRNPNSPPHHHQTLLIAPPVSINSDHLDQDNISSSYAYRNDELDDLLVGLTPKKYKDFSRERNHQNGFAGNEISNFDQINQNNIVGYKNGNNTGVNVVSSSGHHDHLRNNYLDFDLDALENSVSYSDNDDASSIVSFMDNMDLDNF
jgi:hypothetical protein